MLRDEQVDQGDPVAWARAAEGHAGTRIMAILRSRIRDLTRARQRRRRFLFSSPAYRVDGRSKVSQISLRRRWA